MEEEEDMVQLTVQQIQTFLNQQKVELFSSGLVKDWTAWRANMMALAAAASWDAKRKNAELQKGFMGESWHMEANILISVQLTEDSNMT